MKECKYDETKKYPNGITVVGIATGGYSLGTKDIKYGFLDETGKEIVSCKYDYFGDFIGNVAVVGIGSYDFWGNDCSIGFFGKWGCVDTTGEEIVPIGKYKRVGFDGCCRHPYMAAFSENLLAVCEWETEKWGFVDNTGKEIIPCKYDSIDWFPRDTSKKRELFSPPEFFTNGLARVKLCDRWFYIDKMGNEVNNEVS